MKKPILIILILGIIFFVGCTSNSPTETTTTSTPAITASTTTVADAIPSTTTTAATVQTTMTTQQTTTTVSAVGRTIRIDIINFGFKSNTLRIAKGDTVVWTNLDSVPHTVTSDSGGELNSKPLSHGEKYSHTFGTAGTFTYHCNIHTSMKGTVTVE